MSIGDRLTQAEYYAECRAIAVACQRESADHYGELSERLSSALDTHEWTIGNKRHLEILCISRNEDALFDEYGPMTVESPMDAEAFAECIGRASYAAMLADVYECLAELNAEASE